MRLRPSGIRKITPDRRLGRFTPSTATGGGHGPRHHAPAAAWGRPLKVSRAMPIHPKMTADPTQTPDDEASAEDALRLLAQRLVAESACELRTDTGQWIELWLIAAEGATIIASAPRLAVRAGMQLEWRTQLEGQPVVGTFVIDEAAYRSERRARVQLTATHIRTEARQRRHARRGLGAPATLTAITCDRIVDGDWIPATLVNISDSGVGLTTTDTRPRPGDRFRLYLHLLQTRLQIDVRVARTLAHRHGRTYLGCSIIADAVQDPDQITRILQRLDAAQAHAALSPVFTPTPAASPRAVANPFTGQRQGPAGAFSSGRNGPEGLRADGEPGMP